MKFGLTLVLLTNLLLPTLCEAIEVYRFITKSCDVQTGLVVQTDNTNIGLLNTSGKYVSLPRSAINIVLVYNSVNNPIQDIQMTDKLQQNLLDIYVGKEDKPLFTGWAVRFIDEMVFFYDLEGKSYMLDIHKIIKIESPERPIGKIIKTGTNKIVKFGFGRNYPECSIRSKKRNGHLQPMRIFSDQIKIEKWFLNYQTGFKRMKRLRERTNFYALPLLYTGYNSLGLNKYFTEVVDMQEMRPGFPLFFQWSEGKPYLYQHESWIGTNTSDLTPNAEPVLAFSSDMKAHLFHASFIINLESPVPGFASIYNSDDSKYKHEIVNKETAVFTQFNYMALSGIDYGKSSYSAGLYYPIFGIQTGGKNGVFREVLASDGSPVVRYRFIDKTFKFRVLYAYTDYDIQSPSSKELAAYPSEYLDYSRDEVKDSNFSMSQFINENVNHFSLTNHYYRIGFNKDISKEVSIGVDEIILQGHYQETAVNHTDSASPYYSNRVDYRHNITAFKLRRQFSDRVGISFHLNNYVSQQTSVFNNKLNSINESNWSSHAVFEFIL